MDVSVSTGVLYVLVLVVVGISSGLELKRVFNQMKKLNPKVWCARWVKTASGFPKVSGCAVDRVGGRSNLHKVDDGSASVAKVSGRFIDAL